MTQAVQKPPDTGPPPKATGPAPVPADAKPALSLAKPAPPPQRAPQPVAPPKPAPMPMPPVPARRARGRHHALWLSFLLAVVLPAALAAQYLYTQAVDQYASTVAFSVRTEELTSPMEILGGIGQISGASSSDTDILYEFIQSQEIVAAADAALDLRALWAAPEDPVYGFDATLPIEDLVEYWQRMVGLGYDPATGLIEIEARAFRAADAQALAAFVMAESGALINRLSQTARDDATRFAKDELDRAAARLKAARLALATFRNASQTVDPTTSIEARSGVLLALEQQLAEALIENDLLLGTTRTDDPRLDQGLRRIAAIEARIAAEREKIGRGTAGTQTDVLTDLVGTYEGLLVDREFAEQAYLAAMAAHDQALAEARRQSRYLAAHIQPTLAGSATHPDRELRTALMAFFLCLAWSVMVLLLYSVRDRA